VKIENESAFILNRSQSGFFTEYFTEYFTECIAFPIIEHGIATYSVKKATVLGRTIFNQLQYIILSDKAEMKRLV
jgi:hypothetical protein